VEDDEDDEDDEDNEDPLDEDDEDPLHEAIVAQKTRLSEEEVSNLWDIIPPRADFVGVPFVTRLTSTMVDRHDMVCYTYKCKLSDELHWWKKGLWSRFATAISRGCATATERARLKAPPFSRGCLRTATKGPSTWAPGVRRGGGPLVPVLVANQD
jgi:hypothetical protein